MDLKANFTFHNGIRSLLSLILTSFLTFIISFYLSDIYLFSILTSVIITIIIYLIFNKKWFNNVKINQDNLSIEYTLTFDKEKVKSWNYPEIRKVIYYKYMYNTPAHCKVECLDKTIIRFDCNQEEVEAIFDFLKTKNVATEYYNKSKDVYRS